MTPRHHADHVGSLLRPRRLLHVRAGNLEGRISTDALRAEEDLAISAALDKQREIGLNILSDGEMRRGSWLTDMADAVEGFVPDKVILEWKGPGGGAEGSTANAVGAKLRKRRKMTGQELPFLKKSAGAPFKITLPAPSNFVLASYKQGITEPFYPTHADLLEELVEIVRDEIRWLVSEDVTYIQLDAPYYSHFLDPRVREQMHRAGLDPDEEFDKSIAGDNEALREIPRDKVTRAFHVCRGNSRSRWYAEGGYEAIAERLFGALDTDVFLLEYDTERCGGFTPLRLVPRGKTVVLGLVTTKEAMLESQEALRRRIDEAAKFVPIENLALSPQCGFASVAAGNLLSEDDQWRKLELVVETARKVWG
jgi:5-methyltetrahydropteroyltriglutamate--homocysteine methyltransferase